MVRDYTGYFYFKLLYEVSNVMDVRMTKKCGQRGTEWEAVMAYFKILLEISFRKLKEDNIKYQDSTQKPTYTKQI
jgi:hypothetical protein